MSKGGRMTAPELSTLAVGDSAPNVTLPATDGRTFASDSFDDARALAIVFLANHCPYVSAWEERLVHTAREYEKRSVRFAAISSNDVERLPKDSFEAMGRRATEQDYPFPYLYDEDGSVARAFGATRTPEVFLFDAEKILRYHGAIDSDWEESEGREEYLREALEALLNQQKVRVPETKPIGCVIKPKSEGH
jgi:peroxiredoxin